MVNGVTIVWHLPTVDEVRNSFSFIGLATWDLAKNVPSLVSCIEESLKFLALEQLIVLLLALEQLIGLLRLS